MHRFDTSKSTSKKKGVNSTIYRTQILKRALKRPWHNMLSRWRGWAASPRIVEDGARVHSAKICLKERQKQGYKMLFHPPYSPDLNCIEHAWAEVKRRLRQYDPRPRTVDELWEAAQIVWDNIPREYFKKLVDIMKARRRDVQQAKGGASRW